MLYVVECAASPRCCKSVRHAARQTRCDSCCRRHSGGTSDEATTTDPPICSRHLTSPLIPRLILFRAFVV